MHAKIFGSVPIGSTFVVYFAGCNFRCPYCYNSEYFEPREAFDVSLRDIITQIEANAGEVNTVVFTGCEPTLQRHALLSLGRFAKGLGLKTVLETNGSKPDAVRVLINEKLIDTISIDIKSPFEPAVFEKVTKSGTYFKKTEETIEDIKKTLDIIKQSNVNIEIRTTIVPSIIYKRQEIIKIAKIVNELDCRWVLQQFKPNMGEMPSKRMSSIRPPTKEFLNNLKDFCLMKYPNLRIDVFGI